MRQKFTIATLNQFMQKLAAAARSPGKVYFTGGVTALLLGFREQTIEIDLKLGPEPAGAFEAIARLKERLDLNVELASPDDFIPRVADWRERSGIEGPVRANRAGTVALSSHRHFPIQKEGGGFSGRNLTP